MDIRLQLGGITFRLCSRRNLVIDPEWELFLTKRKDDKDIIININWDDNNTERTFTWRRCYLRLLL